jgi:hypothetical protein
MSSLYMSKYIIPRSRAGAIVSRMRFMNIGETHYVILTFIYFFKPNLKLKKMIHGFLDGIYSERLED